MTGVVVLAVLAGLGTLGVLSGLRSSGPSLDVVWTTWSQPVGPREVGARRQPFADRLGRALLGRLERSSWASSGRGRQLQTALAVTATDPITFATQLVTVAGACLVGTVGLWLALAMAGVTVALGAAVLGALAAVPVGVLVVVAALLRRATERRRHFRVVISLFVDLVVLSLAGGVGIDGALHTASLVTPDWAAERIARALQAARDTGGPPWEALAEVGVELDIPDLVELSTTVQLAGTEGTRIRQTLAARGVALRRHEQAEAESAANAMTERLFLPGALLLLGFLVFIGFPAVQRILGGF